MTVSIDEESNKYEIIDKNDDKKEENKTEEVEPEVKPEDTKQEESKANNGEAGTVIFIPGPLIILYICFLKVTGGFSYENHGILPLWKSQEMKIPKNSCSLMGNLCSRIRYLFKMKFTAIIFDWFPVKP